MNTSAVSIVSGVLDISDLPAFLKSLNDFSAERGVKIQGFDARKIAGANHLSFAVHRAREAFAAGTNQAKDLGLEAMRFSSGLKQIDKAFSMGLIQGENRGLFVFFGAPGEHLISAQNAFTDVFGLKKDTPLSLDEKKPFLMKQFGITDEELNGVGADKLEDLVMERVALVDIVR
ncbi:MAG: KEOPS complex subunit Cgi121 [Methanimicrococcus sp.]|nr:KEOPS complex subunit Cgi121 [Methanimicrococcus sp.]